MKNFGQGRQCLSCHALSTASKLFATFVLPRLQRNTRQFKLCWILVYIRGCNILPHSENTFAGNNPIMFHFRATFYCYLLFPCIQNPIILLFFFFPRWCLALLKWFCESKLGKRDSSTAETAYKYGNVLAVWSLVTELEKGFKMGWRSTWNHLLLKNGKG